MYKGSAQFGSIGIKVCIRDTTCCEGTNFMRFRPIAARGWPLLGCVGVLIGITSACGGEGSAYPGAPSQTLAVQSTVPSVTALATAGSAFSASAVTNSAAGGRDSGGSTGLGERDAGSNASGGRGDSSRGRAQDEKRRRQYCRGLEEGHKQYERCQAWLSRNGGSDRQRGDFQRRRRQYCRGLEEGHERYERCQAWLSRNGGQDRQGGDRRRRRR